MSEYMLKPPLLPFPSCNEAKEKRRKVLAAVQARRKISYARYYEKLRRTTSLAEAVSFSA